MKKLAYIVGLGLALGMICSCEDEPKNPGNFDQAAELSLDGLIISTVHSPMTYPLEVNDRRDTTYARVYNLIDTVYRIDEHGDSVKVYGEDGKVLVNKRDTIILSKKTAALIEYKPVMLEPDADTITFKLFTNARWMASDPKNVSSWLFNYQVTIQGGGDSKVIVTCGRNRSANARGPVYQYVYTSDSMVCCKVPFYQMGRK